MDKEKVLKVLSRGMNTEVWGQRFYQEAIARTQAEDGKKVFQSLVEEENKHLDILRGQYAAVSGNKKWVSVQEAQALAASVDATQIFPQASSAEQLIPAGTTDAQALQLAMDFEKRGYEFYTQEAAQAASAEAKTMWEYLAKAENLHYTFLQETHEYLVTNGVWYFDAQELPFFEG